MVLPKMWEKIFRHLVVYRQMRILWSSEVCPKRIMEKDAGMDRESVERARSATNARIKSRGVSGDYKGRGPANE